MRKNYHDLISQLVKGTNDKGRGNSYLAPVSSSILLLLEERTRNCSLRDDCSLLLQLQWTCPCTNTTISLQPNLEAEGGFKILFTDSQQSILMGAHGMPNKSQSLGQCSLGIWRWKMAQAVPTNDSIIIWRRPTCSICYFPKLWSTTPKNHWTDSYTCHCRSHVPKNFIIMTSCLTIYL